MTATSDIDVQAPTDAAGDPDTPELVPPDSLTAEHTGRWTFLIVEGAAFMMQAMHPVIAEVTGKQISALNPEAYQWVIVTGYLVNALGGRLLIGREFTAAEKAELVRDNRRLARLLHVPMRGYPETDQEMTEYFEAMIDTLQATPQAMQLTDDLITGQLELGPSVPRVLYPLIRALLRPAMRLNYLSIVGLLDPRLRAKLGVDWSAAEERQLQRIYRGIRIAYRVLPDRLTYFPLAYHARKHHQCLEKMKERQKKSYAYRVPGAIAP